MHKRKAFAHEQEGRIVKWESKYFHVARRAAIQDTPRVIELPWDAESVVEGLYVNPYAKQWYFETVRPLFSASRLIWSSELSGQTIRADSV